jgi:hypothetical protein
MASNVQQETAGVFAVASELAGFGWFPRVLPPPDQGVDAQVELADSEGRPDGRILGLQVKSGPSYFKRARPGGWLLGLNKHNLAYWARYRLPVVVCLYDTKAKVAYWQAVKPEHLQRSSGGNYSLFVPHTQRLVVGAIGALEKLATIDVSKTSDLEQALRERRAEFDLAWIERLAAGDRIFLEAEEWLNKSSGRGALRLIVEEKEGFGDIERDWPYVFIPGASYAEELPRLFPWASLKIDEAFYAEHDHEKFVAAVGVWDKEDEAYFFPVDFDEWAEESLPKGIRPYAESPDGEIAYWRLELTLNDLGQETLEKARDEEMEAYYSELDDDWTATVDDEYGGFTPYYEGQYLEGHLGAPLERVNFQTGDDFVILAADEVLWTDNQERRKVGESILSHAAGREPTRALVDAFVNRFADVFDDDGMGWTLEQSAVSDWLSELRVAL